MILIVIVHALFSAIFPIGRVATHYSQPIFFTAVRMLIAGIILLGIQYAQSGKLGSDKPVSFNDLKLFGLTALFGVFLTNVLEFWALQFVPATKAAFIYSLSPFFSAIASYFFFSEKFNLKKLIGMAIGLYGFLVMVMHDSPAEISHGGIGFFSLGELALIGSAIVTVFGWMAFRVLIRKGQYQSLEINGITMIWGGVLALIMSFITETWNPIPVNNIMLFSWYLALAILLSNILAYTLYGVLLKRYTVTFLAFTVFIEPLITALYAWVFLGEVVTWRFFPATLLVFCGLYLFYMEELKQGYVIKSTKLR
ncbi:MAG: DMT family transporter [bacterium]|nr:DMT family transporter [bacterium]